MVITTKYGPVKGNLQDGVLAFKGVPYAAKALGENRFKKVGAPEKWTDTLETKEFSPKCPQLRIPIVPDNGIKQDEDCLYMNVYAPENVSVKKPVLFWIYGGAFASGEGSTDTYDANEFVKNGDIVVVNFNYRVGVFGGFYNFNSYDGCDEYVPNAGFYDVLNALKWVKENIEAFGGDPDRVTICGESAGATIVSLLLCCDMAKGLFSQAIMESCYNSVPASIEDKETTDKIIECAGVASAAEFLQLDTDKVMEAVSNSCGGNPLMCGAGIQQMDWFKVPISEMLRKAVNDVPTLMGFNHDEGMIFLPPGAPQEQVNEVTRAMFEAPIDGYLMSDRGSATYIYRFDYVPGPVKAQGMGAIHSAEMGYVYHNLTVPSEKMAMSDPVNSENVSMEMHRDWIKFIHGEELWDRATSENQVYKKYDVVSEICKEDWHL